MQKERIKVILAAHNDQATKTEDYYNAGPYANIKKVRGWILLLAVDVTRLEDVQALLDGGPDIRECKFSFGNKDWRLSEWEVDEAAKRGRLIFKGYEKKQFIFKQ